MIDQAAHDQGKNVRILGVAATQAEWAARQAKGLPVSHCLDMQEFPFAFARAELATFTEAAKRWAEQCPEDASAHQNLAYALAANRDYAEANLAFARAGRIDPISPHHAINMGHVEQVSVELPRVEGVWPAQPCLFISCDVKYLRVLSYPLLKTMAGFAPGQHVHLHVMGPPVDPDVLRAQVPVTRLSITQEDPVKFAAVHGITPENYYGAARFIRMAQALEVNPGPLWMTDVDALIHRDPRALFNLAGDMAMRVRPARLEPWHQFSACLVMGRPAALPYFRCVADIIAANLSRAFWGLDQYALFSAYLNLQARGTLPDMALLGPVETDVESSEAGVIWYTAGKAKERLFAWPRPADPTPYELLFWKNMPPKGKLII